MNNCLFVAIGAWLRHPLSTKIKVMRNRSRQLHFYWEYKGQRYEWYAPNRSQYPWYMNLLYKGEIRKIK